MALSPGDTLGPFEILAALGAGGMGDVYKARDTRLNREVAIKTTRAEFSGRFQREARAVAALNHANICTLHDVGPDYLVMELLSGETLSSLLRNGPLPMDTVLRYGAQIAAALAAAHAKGITHRDLKPANIMVTREGIKVLDFGLAKFGSLQSEDAHALPAEAQPTATAPLTCAHIVMGTPGYMAPEQLQGLTCDARTDIFALGLVLFEMTVAKRPFPGQTTAAVNAAVLREEPAPLEGVSRYFAHLVDRCLAKDPEQRWQSAADIRLQLDFLANTGPVMEATAERKPSPSRLWPLAAAAAVFSAIAAGIYQYSGGTHMEMTLTPITSYSGSEVTPSFSPDGTQMAFAWNGAGGDNFDVYVKQIGAGEPIRITRDPARDFVTKWSPDGKWIAFLRMQGRDAAALLVVPALGGLERKLADGVTVDPGDGYWGNWFDNLDWTPDSKWLMIAKRPAPGQPPGLVLLSFETGETRPLLPPAASPYEAATIAPDGHALAYWQEPGGLKVQPLSASYEAVGPAREIPLGGKKPTFVPSIAWTANSEDLLFSVGTRENSALWRVASTGNAPPKPVSLVGEGAAGQAVSRHGDRLVFSRYDREFDLWSLPLDPTGKAGGPAVRAFNSTKSELNPHFSPDGTRVALASNRSGNDEVWVCLSDGTNCSQLTNFGGPQVGTPRWSPDGNWIAFDLFQGGPSIQVVSSGGGKPRRVTNGLLPRWSMDGRWIYAWCLPDPGICRTRVEGGRPEKLLDAVSAIDMSPDGVWLYYSPNVGQLSARPDNRAPSTTVNRIPVAGGKSEEVLRGAAGGQRFVVTTSGIWFLTPNSAEGSLLQFYDFATKSTRTVYRAIRPVYSGLAISPDQSRILFSQIERQENHDLVMAEPFR